MHPYHKHRESERKAGHARYRAEGGKVSDTASGLLDPSTDYPQSFTHGAFPVSLPAPAKPKDVGAPEK